MERVKSIARTAVLTLAATAALSLAQVGGVTQAAFAEGGGSSGPIDSVGTPEPLVQPTGPSLFDLIGYYLEALY